MLGDGLEALLGQGADSLEALSQGLNEQKVLGPNGQKWNASLLADELKRLGAG